MKRKLMLLVLLTFFIFKGGSVYADTLKNIPLGDWKVSFGADNRLRYEATDDYNFRENDSSSKVFNRLKLNSRLKYKDTLSLFVEGLDGREWVHNIKRGTQFDDFDLHQAYLEIPDILGTKISLKAGRQTLNYGKKRLLAKSTWGNKIRSFDATVIKLNLSNLTTDVFAANVVNYDDNNFNKCQGHELLSGIYNTYKFNDNALVDVYLISQVDKDTPVAGEDRRTGRRERHTSGSRINIKPLKDLTIDLEAAYQFGKNGTSDIAAYALAFYVEKKFDTNFNPKIKLEFNLASGDDDLTDNEYNTFIPVYQTTHGPYGIIDLFRWQNLREIALFGSLDITKKFSIKPEFHSYWLDADADGWYNSSGSRLFANTTGNTDSGVGAESSLVMSYALNKHVNLEMGYSHFFCGDVAEEAGEDDGIDFGYFQTIVSF